MTCPKPTPRPPTLEDELLDIADTLHKHLTGKDVDQLAEMELGKSTEHYKVKFKLKLKQGTKT